MTTAVQNSSLTFRQHVSHHEITHRGPAEWLKWQYDLLVLRALLESGNISIAALPESWKKEENVKQTPCCLTSILLLAFD